MYSQKNKILSRSWGKAHGQRSLSLPFSAPFVSRSVTYGLVPPLVEAIHHCVSVSMHTHPVGNFQKGWKGFGLTATWFNFLCFSETLLKWSVHYWAQYVAATIPSKEVLLWLGSCSWCFEFIQGEHVCQGGIVVVLLCPEDIKAVSDVSVEYTFSQTISLGFPDHPFLGYVHRDFKVLLCLKEVGFFFQSAPDRPSGHSGGFNKTSLFTSCMVWSGSLSSLGSSIQPHLNVVNKKGLKIVIQHCNKMLRGLHSK